MTASLLVAVAGTAFGCVGILLTVSPSRRPAVAGLGTAIVGLLGITTGSVAIAGNFTPVTATWLIPFSDAHFTGDGLSGLFVVVTGVVAVASGLFTVGYARKLTVPATALAALPLFVGGMVVVPLASSVTTFLFVWELMALTSLALVLAEYRHRAARDAGLMYAAMTQLSFVGILIGLAVFAAGAHTETFSGMAAAARTLPSTTKTAIFLTTFIGFGSKAGLVPLHAWLPRAHPEAPSFASALMSAAMVNLGIYGIVRFDVVLLGTGPRWWGLVVMIIGAGTAVYAVLQASVAVDLKRLLAYSTSENMGLIALAVGTGMLLDASGNRRIAAVALTAALLHLVAHAAFKSLGFLGAGSVLSSTGHRDLDSLGGLVHAMPVTTGLFGVAALGATGLPLGAGFASEWLLLQSLVHALPAGGVMLPLVMPFAVGAVALTTGLGVATMVKAFGVGFLARSRSDGARVAVEAAPSMQIAMALPAVVCVALGVAPAVLAPALRSALQTIVGSSQRNVPSLKLLLRLPGVPGSISPLLLSATVGGGIVVALLFAAVGSRRRPARRSVPLWSSGAGALSPRMQYTATSFAEPLQRVFHDVLRPDSDVTVTHIAESRYLIEQVRYRSRVVDSAETRLYEPVVRGVVYVANLLRRAHAGSVHAYLAYGAAALLIFLMIATR